MLSSEACGVDARGTTEGFHLKSRIVGEAIEAVVLPHIASLDQGIAFQGIGSLGDLLMALEVREADDLYAISQDSPYLGELMSIIARKHKFFHTFVT